MLKMFAVIGNEKAVSTFITTTMMLFLTQLGLADGDVVAVAADWQEQAMNLFKDYAVPFATSVFGGAVAYVAAWVTGNTNSEKEVNNAA